MSRAKSERERRASLARAMERAEKRYAKEAAGIERRAKSERERKVTALGRLADAAVRHALDIRDLMRKASDVGVSVEDATAEYMRALVRATGVM